MVIFYSNKMSNLVSEISGLFNIVLLLSVLSLLIILVVKYYLESRNQELEEKIKRNFSKKISKKKINKQKKKKKENSDSKCGLDKSLNQVLISTRIFDKVFTFTKKIFIRIFLKFRKIFFLQSERIPNSKIYQQQIERK